MIVYLCLVLATAAQATPVGKVIPVYEDVSSLRLPSETRLGHRTWCIDDCHHHILQKPVIVVLRNLQGTHSLHYSPIGLNGLAKSNLTMPLHENILSAESKVAVIFPFARFPFELFPGLADTEITIPEHVAQLSSIYKEAPIITIFPEEEFRKINERRGLIQVADLSAESTGFTIAKEYALLNRNAALGSSASVNVPHDVTPGVVQPQVFASAPGKSQFIHSGSPGGGFSSFGGNGISIGGGEGLRFFSNPPVAPSFYTSVPSAVF